MIESVVVKGWRTRLQEARDLARAKIWCTVSSSVDYDNDFKVRRVYLGFCPVVQQEVRSLLNRARRVDRSEWAEERQAEHRRRQREWHRAWRSRPDNAAKHRAWGAAWAEANPDKVRAKAARYRETHGLQRAIYMQLLRLSKRDG